MNPITNPNPNPNQTGTRTRTRVKKETTDSTNLGIGAGRKDTDTNYDKTIAEEKEKEKSLPPPLRVGKDINPQGYVYRPLGPMTYDIDYLEPKNIAGRDWPRSLNRTKGTTRYPNAYVFELEYYRQWDKREDRVQGKGPLPDNKYYLSVMSIFKNEGHIMEEWLEHHIGHGVEHFYLVDDGSTDNAKYVLDPYIEKGIVTMFPTTSPKLKFRQGALYQRMFHEIYANNETFWLAVLDLDEFLFSPRTVDIPSILRRHEDLSVVGVNWLIFGSQGMKTQPRSVTQSFYHRGGLHNC